MSIIFRMKISTKIKHDKMYQISGEIADTDFLNFFIYQKLNIALVNIVCVCVCVCDKNIF